MKTCYFVGNQFQVVRSVLASFAADYTRPLIHFLLMPLLHIARYVCVLFSPRLAASRCVPLIIFFYLYARFYYARLLSVFFFIGCHACAKCGIPILPCTFVIPISRNVFSIAHIIYYRVRMCVFAFPFLPRPALMATHTMDFDSFASFSVRFLIGHSGAYRANERTSHAPHTGSPYEPRCAAHALAASHSRG